LTSQGQALGRKGADGRLEGEVGPMTKVWTCLLCEPAGSGYVTNMFLDWMPIRPRLRVSPDPRRIEGMRAGCLAELLSL
jgi:hypothetical protein